MKGFGFLTCLLVLGVGSSSSAQESKSLETRVYLVTPFVGSYPVLDERGGNSSGGAADPFAEPEPAPRARFPKSVQEYFTNEGIVFGDGASVELDRKTWRLTATNSESELDKVERLLEIIRSRGEFSITVYVEFIEVDHAEFSDWLFDNRMDSDGTELRKEVQLWIKAGRGEIIDSATVVGRSGQRAKIESIDEYIYPTEYDPAEVSNKVVLKDGAEARITAVTPTAFETQNLGTTLEVDPVLGADEVTVDLNLVPEITRLEGTLHWHHKMKDPLFQIHMPTFYTMKITTQVVTRSGRYAFLGTTRPLEPANPQRTNPIVLQFVRADVGSTADWNRVDERE